jgi:hypothetical protein
VLKPFTVPSLVPRLKTGKRRVMASDDIIYCPAAWEKDSTPPDIQKFSDWLVKTESQDLLNTWGES